MRTKIYLPDSSPYDNFRKAFSANLRKLMDAKGWDEGSLAVRMGPFMPEKTISENAVRGYLLGARVPSQKGIKALCQVLECEPLDLFPSLGEKESAPPETVANTMRVTEAGGGNMWVVIDKTVPWETALKVASLIQEDRTRKT